ncbi:MAG: hypothetical protein GY752_00705 [bacterium]|nr:hypothetical protein [bacterium]MCP4800159.1 hypothetical protein [bacterium]
MTKSRILIMVAALALLASGCGVDTPESVTYPVTVPSGAGYFANYIAIGNSFTAGFQDGGLHVAGQSYSYPQQIASALGYPAGSFVQPLINHPGIGSTDTGDPAFTASVLHWTGTSIGLIGETPTAEVPNLLLASSWPVPYSNLGVPGATTNDILNCTDSSNSQSPGNGYFDFILRNPTFGNVTMIDQAINRGPTLVTCWIGNNDILGGATSGEPAVFDGVNGNITPPSVFQTMYEGILDKIAAETMLKSGWEPMIMTANIPSISSAPYFMPQVVFEAIMAGAGYPHTITYEETPEYVLFPALSFLDPYNPVDLPASLTLDAAEVDIVESMVVAYNDIIAAAAAARGIMVYDANAALAGMTAVQKTHFLALLPAAGYDVATAASMTEFSLDGIHPNSHGYSLVAQGFLDLINGAFGTEFEAPVDLGSWDPTYGLDPTPPTAAAPEAFTAIERLFN